MKIFVSAYQDKAVVGPYCGPKPLVIFMSHKEPFLKCEVYITYENQYKCKTPVA